MRKTHALSSLVIALLLLCGLLMLLDPLQARSQSPDPAAYTAPPLRGQDDQRPPPLDRAALPPLDAQDDGLKAVAIVGHVEGLMSSLKSDMDAAVNALQDHGVTVETFYYGERSFTWKDIVAAASNAHFLLYMGHGMYWGGSCTNPTLVGGFYLGPGQYVHPDDVRDDLGGRLAENSVAILSHACFSAGNTSCDPSGQPSQDEAERRVRMYASAFVDIGMQAYYANNYYYSAADYVDQLLADPATRKNAGDIFKSVYPYNSSLFRDLTYPDTPGYDLWLSGSTGDWSDAFVGIPDYVFGSASSPELGSLPASLDFTYNLATTSLSPPTHTIALNNVGGEDTLNWNATKEGTWFTVSPTSGGTPDDVTITPENGVIAGLGVGHYTGAVTVAVTDPPDTKNSVQRVDLGLDVVVPQLGGLPGSVSFTYFLSESVSLPAAHEVTPQNVGSDDTLTWELASSSDWLTTSVASGQTPDEFAITLDGDEIAATGPATYTGWITVNVSAPAGAQDPTQAIAVTLHTRNGGPDRVYLPLTMRND